MIPYSVLTINTALSIEKYLNESYTLPKYEPLLTLICGYFENRER